MKRTAGILTVAVSVAVFAAAAFASGDVMEKAQVLFKPVPNELKEVKGIPITPQLVDLGKALYFDPRLSKSGLISCNTCHNIGMGGADFQQTAVGHGWHKGPRNSPTVFNSVFNIAQFWDGRAPDLKEQAKGPIQAAVEMNNTPGNVVATLKSMPQYVEMFSNAFPGEKDPVTFDNMAGAIEVFEATLLTPDSRFDRFLKGDENALGSREKSGLEKFMARGCSACHGGINMGGTGYYKFGVRERPDASLLKGDKGRYKVTSIGADEYSFKSPSLRNIALTPPYFHSGKVWSLDEAVSIMGNVQLGVSLTDRDISDIVAFLHAATGVQPKVEYPVLPAPAGSTPRPELD
ncbi:MAG: cytochrome-c peroxidase [Candidatus Sulfobium sp.]|jgi:cytochrome c peroxidase